MGIITRQSISNTVITYAGIGLGFVLTIFLYPHILSPDQYGLTRVLISAAFIGSQFAHLGMHHAVVRYFPFFSSREGGKSLFLIWAVVIPLFGFTLFTLLFLLMQEQILNFYADRSSFFLEYHLWILPLTFFILYFEVLNSYLRSQRDAVTGSLYNEVILRIAAILAVTLYFLEWISFSTFIAMFVLSYLLQPVAVLMRILSLGALRIRPDFSLMRKKLRLGMAKYSFFSLLGGLTTVLVWNIDILMLGSMAGLEWTAVYAIAFYMGSVITVPQRAIEKIAAPVLAEMIQKKKWMEVDNLYKKTALNQLLPGFLLFGVIWILSDLFYLMMPEIYAAGKWVLLIIGIGKLIEMGTGANGIILINSKHYRVSFYTNMILVFVTIGANYLLIPQYGIEGAAIASALALLVYNAVKYLYIRLRMQLSPFSKEFWIALFLGSVAFTVASLINPADQLILNLLLKGVLFLSLFLVPAVRLSLSADFNRQLSQLLSSFRR
ncbi:MAG: lipopolysaccharide biosynthesis protein [Balneolaceae bacterium]|nr:MAG: lipopolysaccharide biosynthesis protein [Balneolaceae bacterium]